MEIDDLSQVWPMKNFESSAELFSAFLDGFLQVISHIINRNYDEPALEDLKFVLAEAFHRNYGHDSNRHKI